MNAYGENRRVPPERRRFVPDRELPTYTYIPGRTPHPGHGEPDPLQKTAAPSGALPEDPQQRIREYLYGVDLFNHGYYWESHEVWEELWHAAGRSGPTADFFKGLIKLAAAGVKTLEGSAIGRRRHARRAAELFLQAADGFSADRDAETSARGGRAWYLGLSLQELATLANRIAVCSTDMSHPPARPEEIFGFALAPEIENGPR